MRKSFQCYQGTLSVVFNDDDVLFILFPLFLLFLDSPLVVFTCWRTVAKLAQ